MLTAVLSAACSVNDPEYRDSGQAFANATIQAVATKWDADALIQRADPQFLEALPEPKARELIANLSKELGPLKKVTPVLATVGYNAGAWFGKAAQYVSTLECEKGRATLVLVVRKRGAEWRVLGFHANIDQAP